MRVLIFGKTGQVARELARARWPQHVTLLQLGRSECDLDNPERAREAIIEARPRIVVNAAAYTAVDSAETEPERATRINCDAPEAMASACVTTNAALIHLSTDYVFDGDKAGAYLEQDCIAPLSIYGRSKADGEIAVRESLQQHVILRTSWVFASQGNNFVRTMLRLGDQRPELRIVDDQRGAPTAARDIAEAIVSIVLAIGTGKAVWGTFHFTGSEPTTWYGFAQAIFAASDQLAKLVPITTADYKTAARRPMNSVLDCGRILRDYGIPQPSWRAALIGVLAEIRRDEPGTASQ
ncbi:MAG: dTDP-4-dehydrorhamnose reductase [Rhizomicrobium sp.]